MKRKHNSGCGWHEAIVATGFLLAAALPGSADPIADFYRGRTVTIDVGFEAGGGYDLHARTLARYMGRHLPGAPNFVVRNVPGAAGLVLLNNIYNSAPKDGTEFATFDRSVPLDPLLFGSATLAHFDPLRFLWIGSTADDVSTCLAWHTAPVKTFKALLEQELIVAGTGTAGGEATVYPRLLNAVLGTKFRVVSGYPGTSTVALAMQRGEVQGYCGLGFATIEATQPDWFKNNLVNVLVQLGMHKDANHPDIPLAFDLAANDADRETIQLAVSPQQFSRPFAGPPGIPTDRAKALQDAFDATVQDPDFIADAIKEGLQISLVRGETIQQLLERDYKSPSAVIDRVRAAVQ